MSILKNKIEKKNWKKILIKIQQKKKKISKTLWITIVIHNTMGVGWTMVPSFNFCYFIKFNSMIFLKKKFNNMRKKNKL